MVVSLLTIDGSYGEGGGQILRTAVALSVVTKKPVEIVNIRSKRPDPGIKPQHYVAIKSMEELCGGESTDLEIGSSHLIFKPGEIKGGNYKFDIGTAGSITLVFQALLLSAFKTHEPITINVKGGTDVKWAPSWDYFNYVFLSLLKKMGVSVDAQLIKRGYYPKGGGEGSITIKPSSMLHPLFLDEKQNFTIVDGIIHSANLPEDIGKRMKHAAIKTLMKKNLKANITFEDNPAFSTGIGITLWTKSDSSILGSTMLGERGVPAEKIGGDAALNLIKDIESGANIDPYAFDQVIPYLAIIHGGSSCVVREISNHAKTNMWLVKQFFDIDFKLEKFGNATIVTVGSI
ncbi:MAG: RNA 3'-terminal phosphate cyclase [Candidatus Thermoplasmatota archaeon]|jgi:RNA 3'-phosphate cyclase|nr:RNA 3'-terminal phosphate cyclase [Candidatus Thermoplasmatota archaeon]